MKLAEALLKRAQLKEDSDGLRDRILNNALVQEGDEPAEDPAKLLPVYAATMQQLDDLIRKINHANSSTEFGEGETIADALARRSSLMKKQRTYQSIYDKLQIQPNRYSATEIRFVRCLDPASVQKMIDGVSKEYRELDTKLQALNWTVELD